MCGRSFGRSHRFAAVMAVCCALLLLGSEVFAISFLGKDRTPVSVSGPVASVETKAAVDTEGAKASLDSLDKTINELSETVNSLKEGQRLDDKTLSSLSNGSAQSVAIQNEYDRLLKDANRLHFGIGAGVEYHQPTSVGVSLDASLRWHSLMLVTGVTYYPINDGKVTDKSRIGGHASLIYEF